MRYFEDGAEAPLREVLLAWRADHPDMGVCAWVPEAEKALVARLQALCAECAVPLVGAIFPALVVNDAFCDHGVWLLRFDSMPGHALLTDLPQDTGGAQAMSAVIAERVIQLLPPCEQVTLLMIFDAMVPNISTLLDDTYLRLANRVHYAGANAGSETFTPMPCLFDSARLVGDGVLLVLLPDHAGAILEHGYRAPLQTVYATSTQGNRIEQIDWRPAFDVYQELVQKQYGVQVTRSNFYNLAVHFPFGIVRANHCALVRIPVALNEDGSLYCVGEVPANAVLTLLEQPKVDTHETLRVLVDGLQALNGPVRGRDLLLFYCAGRRLHLGLEAATDELRAFVRHTEAAQVAGALSLGEIGGSTLHGYPLFHNATLVTARW